jgi:nucleoside 2-deoxyribosyltransferase
LKVYLSVPMIANRSLARARVLERAIISTGNEVSSPWVLGPIEVSSHGVNIFDRDRRGAETSDAILADVTEPSTGVGMEIMAAYKAGKRVIAVAKSGSKVSRMLLHMDGMRFVEFADDGDLYQKVVALLKSRPDGSESASR